MVGLFHDDSGGPRLVMIFVTSSSSASPMPWFRNKAKKLYLRVDEEMHSATSLSLSWFDELICFICLEKEFCSKIWTGIKKVFTFNLDR